MARCCVTQRFRLRRPPPCGRSNTRCYPEWGASMALSFLSILPKPLNQRPSTRLRMPWPSVPTNRQQICAKRCVTHSPHSQCLTHTHSNLSKSTLHVGPPPSPSPKTPQQRGIISPLPSMPSCALAVHLLRRSFQSARPTPHAPHSTPTPCPTLQPPTPRLERSI